VVREEESGLIAPPFIRSHVAAANILRRRDGLKSSDSGVRKEFMALMVIGRRNSGGNPFQVMAHDWSGGQAASDGPESEAPERGSRPSKHVGRSAR